MKENIQASNRGSNQGIRIDMWKAEVKSTKWKAVQAKILKISPLSRRLAIAKQIFTKKIRRIHWI